MTEAAIAQLVGTLSVCWAMGFGIGKAVAWVRHLAHVT